MVSERRDVARDLWIVRLRPETRIAFLAGQYLTIGLPVEGRLIERPYSVASAPADPELEFFLEVVPGGKLSPQLYDVPPGGEVYIRPAAKGRFTMEHAGEPANHFMAATVTGVAPFVSMVRDRAAREAGEPPWPGRIVILQAASSPAELGYEAELTALAKERSWLEYIPAVSRIWLDPAWRGERGRIEDVARKYLDALPPAPASTVAYLCGNPHMIRNMEGVLARVGIPAASVKKENYWPAGR